jgi:methyl-accepting chemotaxis protein
MKEVVEALSQIEEAAEIAKNDADKANEIASKSVKYITIVSKDVNGIFKDFKIMMAKFVEISKELTHVQEDTLTDIDLAKKEKQNLETVKSKIKKLNNVIRKIELAIVQIGALSINGAVEAVRFGENGRGFSEVSHDIRELADTSEEKLDNVIDIIDEVSEENDKMLLDINNIVISLEKEIGKIKELINEFNFNVTSLKEMTKKIELVKNSIEEMKKALEQVEIAAKQTNEAAHIAKENSKKAKESANVILSIAKEMNLYANKLKKLSLKLKKSE